MQRIVTVLDTALTVNYNDRPISTQKDLDTYKFQFDDSWLGYVKTAVFYTDPAMVKHLLIPEDGVVTIPWEIITGKPQVLYIGVFGVKDNIVKPTTFGAVRLREGSYIDGIAPLPPTPDVYQQIIGAWEDAKVDETARIANENSRRSNFDALVVEYNALKAELEQEITDGTASVDALQVLEADYAAKALILESEYAPQLAAVASQLAETMNKTSITLSHQFIDNTGRDTYFTANPLEKINLTFIKVGTGYQQLINNVWTSASPVLVEMFTPQSARVYNNANISVANSTNMPLPFNSESFDDSNMHDAINPSRLTCKVAGKYLIIGQIEYAANANGVRSTMITKNGDFGQPILRVSDGPTTAILNPRLVVSTLIDLTIGDYVELYAYQNSGVALNVAYVSNYSPVFSMVKVG